jgi:hypothetical protein
METHWNCLKVLLRWGVPMAIAVAAVAASSQTDSAPRAGLSVAGGLSAGWCYASGQGPGGTTHQPALTNLLVTLASAETKAPLRFELGLGAVSAPSLTANLGHHADLGAEYAVVAWRLHRNIGVAAGLLQPSSGYEDTYTFNNVNVATGLIASQQPYNAYGGAAQWERGPLRALVAVYGDRLAAEEYAVGERLADRAWEGDFGIETRAGAGHLYHYHVPRLRALTGAAWECDLGAVDLAVNADWWRWDSAVAPAGARNALGVAVYLQRDWAGLSLPLRLEAVRQGRSRVYVDHPDAKVLAAAAITPTWRPAETSYVRLETSCLVAREAFADARGRIRDRRLAGAAELGYRF